MKGIVILALGVIFVTLISGSIKSISADHLELGQGVFSSEDEIRNVTSDDQIIK